MMADKIDSFGSITNPGFTSPYLNFDPSILNPSGSQFIIPEGQGEHKGKMEMAFFTIGTSTCLGGLFGGMNGLFSGLKETGHLKGNIRYSQIINYATKRGSISAQSLGTIALMYSLYDTLLSNVREVDDEVNIVASGFLTGVTYGSPHGLKRIIKGGAVGFTLTLGYLAYTRREYLKSLFSSVPNH